jgi:dCMP deaminase
MHPDELNALVASATRCVRASHDPEVQVVASLRLKHGGGIHGYITGVNHFPWQTSAWGRNPSREFVNKRITHAERSIIYQAAYYGIATRNGELYSSLYPCSQCANAIVEAGIRDVFTHPQPLMPEWQEDWKVAEEIFKDNRIDVRFVPHESVTKVRPLGKFELRKLDRNFELKETKV